NASPSLQTGMTAPMFAISSAFAATKELSHLPRGVQRISFSGSTCLLCERLLLLFISKAFGSGNSMSALRVGVNIEHIATLRQARYASMLESKNAEPDIVVSAATMERAVAQVSV